MASGDFCLPGEGMEIVQQVCSKQFPPCNLREEDLLQNPHFSQLLLSLSKHVDESGLSLSLAKEQAEDFAWMRARLQLEVEEQLKRKCFALLCYHDPSSDADSETLKAAKVWKLAEDMVAEKQQCQDAQSQHKEQLVLLEKKSTTYTQVLLRCLTLLQRLLREHRLQAQSKLDHINAQYLEVKCSAMILKLRMEELKIVSDTYTTENVEVHRIIRDRLEASIRLQEQDMQKSRQALSTYEVLGEDFDRLVKEYTRLKQAVENKRWALQEFSRSDS